MLDSKTSVSLLAVALCSLSATAQTYSGPGTYNLTLTSNTTLPILVRGGDGGDSGDPALRSRKGGSGAEMIATYNLLAGDNLTVFVGEKGEWGGSDSRAGGGGGGGSAVILNGTTVLIVAAGGGGSSRSWVGGAGLANLTSAGGGGLSGPNTWSGGGGGGFNGAGQNTIQAIGGGGAGTLTSSGAAGASSSGGGRGGAGWGGGGGSWFQGGGGGGGYTGGNGSFNNVSQAFGGDSYVDLSVRGGMLVSNTPGTDGGGLIKHGLVCIGPCLFASNLSVGAGCGGVGYLPPILGVAPGSGPILGTTLTLDLASPSTPNQSAMLTVGLSTTSDAVLGALPADLTPFGMTGCFARCSTGLANLFLTCDPSGAASYSTGIPNAPYLINLPLNWQAYTLAPGANPGGAITSNGVACRVGI